MIFLDLLFFIFGLIIGSFLNVIIVRLNTGESILKNRSHCMDCKKQLRWYELIPIFSFVIQRGKCRNCRKKISLQYSLVEIFSGLIFVLIFITRQSILDTGFLLVVSCFLIIIFAYDLKHYLVLDAIVYPAIIIAFAYRIFESGFSIEGIINPMVAAIIAGGFFLIMVLMSRGKWMGMGDVKIGFLMGLILGYPQIIVALFLAFFIGAIISIILMILKKKNLKSEIPFGPFLVSATFLALFFGEFLLKLYLGILN